MAETIDVKTGQLVISHNDNVISSGSIGSCVVIGLYDEKLRIGGLAHSMLPRRKSEKGSGELSARYVDEAVDALIQELQSQGSAAGDLVASIVGGARMFKHLTGDNKGIGFQNVEQVKEKLSSLKIPIAFEEVGGSHGRVVLFDLKSGNMTVSSK